MAERKADQEKKNEAERKAYLEDLKNMIDGIVERPTRQERSGWPKRDDHLTRSDRGQYRKVECLPRD
jgi:hypothetical protein